MPFSHLVTLTCPWLTVPGALRYLADAGDRLRRWYRQEHPGAPHLEPFWIASVARGKESVHLHLLFGGLPPDYLSSWFEPWAKMMGTVHLEPLFCRWGAIHYLASQPPDLPGRVKRLRHWNIDSDVLYWPVLESDNLEAVRLAYRPKPQKRVRVKRAKAGAEARWADKTVEEKLAHVRKMAAARWSRRSAN